MKNTIIKFSSGKVIDPSIDGIIGINDRLEISEGRDSPLWTGSFTKQENLELCGIMIQRWKDLEHNIVHDLSHTKEIVGDKERWELDE